MALNYYTQKLAIQKNLQQIEKNINKEKITLGILLSKNQVLLPINGANELYKNCAKQTFSDFETALSKLKGADISPLSNHMSNLMQANKHNVLQIKKNVSVYQHNKTKRNLLARTYMKSLENLGSVVTNTKQQIATELTELEHLQSLKVK